MMLTLITFPCLLATLIVLMFSETVLTAAVSPVANGDYVVLLHGLGRTAVSMSRLQSCLRKEGYQVINVTYPSTRFSIEYLPDVWLHRLLEDQIRNSKVR